MIFVRQLCFFLDVLKRIFSLKDIFQLLVLKKKHLHIYETGLLRFLRKLKFQIQGQLYLLAENYSS